MLYGAYVRTSGLTWEVGLRMLVLMRGVSPLSEAVIRSLARIHLPSFQPRPRLLIRKELWGKRKLDRGISFPCEMDSLESSFNDVNGCKE